MVRCIFVLGLRETGRDGILELAIKTTDLRKKFSLLKIDSVSAEFSPAKSIQQIKNLRSKIIAGVRKKLSGSRKPVLISMNPLIETSFGYASIITEEFLANIFPEMIIMLELDTNLGTIIPGLGIVQRKDAVELRSLKMRQDAAKDIINAASLKGIVVKNIKAKKDNIKSTLKDLKNVLSTTSI